MNPFINGRNLHYIKNNSNFNNKFIIYFNFLFQRINNDCLLKYLTFHFICKIVFHKMKKQTADIVNKHNQKTKTNRHIRYILLD